MSLTNVWHLRKVAETSSKACYICYKPTASVLDHFYVCLGHLKDRAFCSPIVDEAEAAAKRKKEEMDREIELIKEEYDGKMKKKKKAKDTKSKQKEDEKKKEEEEAKQAEQEKDDKIKSLTSKEDAPSPVDDIPRIYALHKIFYQMRLDRIRNSEIAKRNRERLKNPTVFPSVPKNEL